MSGTATGNRSAIRTFVAYRLVSRGYFHLSVLFVFLLQSGHSTLAVTTVLAVYGLAMAVMTPLTPRMVGRLGAGRALTAGELLKATGLVMLALGASSLPVAIAAQVVNAVGFALTLSADAALAGRLGDADTVRKLQASTQSLMFIALLVSGVAGGGLYLAGHRWPLLAGAVTAVAASGLAAVLSSGMPDAPAPATGGVAGGTAGARRLHPPEVRWIVYYVMTRGFMLGTFIGLLPYLIFRVLHAGVLALTVYLAAYSLAAFATARYANKLIGRFSAPVFAAGTAATLLLSLTVFAVSSSAAPVVAAMVLLGAASGCVRPATMAELAGASQQLRGGPVPGWLVSRMEGLFGLCNAGVVLLGGVVIHYWSFTTAMLTLCAVYAALQVVAELYARRRQPADDHAAAGVTVAP